MKTHCGYCGKEIDRKPVHIRTQAHLYCNRDCLHHAQSKFAYIKTIDEIMPFVKADSNGCWNWQGRLCGDGYGTETINGKEVRMHRFVYQLLHGGVPHGRIICHTCDNPACVNPEHLYAGTYADNAHDRDNRNRFVKLIGEKNGSSKLTVQKVQEIRQKHAQGFTNRQLCTEYGVDWKCIDDIAKRKKWKHVE